MTYNCVEWDVKPYYTILYLLIIKKTKEKMILNNKT